MSSKQDDDALIKQFAAAVADQQGAAGVVCDSVAVGRGWDGEIYWVLRMRGTKTSPGFPTQWASTPAGWPRGNGGNGGSKQQGCAERALIGQIKISRLQDHFILILASSSAKKSF